MTHYVKRLAKGKRGMEALQSILLLAAAFVIVTALKGLGNQAQSAASSGIGSLFGGS